MTSASLAVLLMIGGAILVVAGFVGFALNRNKEVESEDASLEAEIGNNAEAPPLGDTALPNGSRWQDEAPLDVRPRVPHEHTTSSN